MKDSLKWSTLGASLNKVLSISVFVVLARELPPSDFGVIAIVSILLGFVKIFTENGYREAIIYFKFDESDPKLSSTFYLLLFVNSLFFLIVVGFNRHISNFFNGGYEQILLYVAFLLPLFPFRVISLALLESRMEFRTIAIVEFSAQIIASIIAIVLAYSGYGVWSLVSMLILNELLLTAFLAYWSRWKLLLRFSFDDLKHIYHYSIHLVIFSTVNFIVENVDKVLIGKYIGKADVGMYQRAQQVTVMPVMFVTKAISRVFFPYLSSIRDETERVGKLHVDSILCVLLVMFPFMSVLIVFPNEIVATVLNDRWIGMTPFLKIFSIMSLLQLIGFLSVNIYKSLGKTKMQSNVNLILKTIILISIVIGVNYGVIGLAYSLLTARVINFFITQYYVCDILKINYSKMLLNISKIVAFFVVVVVSSIYLKNHVDNIDTVGILICSICSYLLVFFCVIYFVFNNRSKYMLSLLKGK